MGKLTISMDIFNSYVSLPEGMFSPQKTGKLRTNLVGGIPTPLKNDGVSSSVGMMFHSQLFLGSHKINSSRFQSPPTRYIVINHRLTID